MRPLVKGSIFEGGHLVVDPWVIVRTEAELALAPLATPVIVSLALWNVASVSISERHARIGVLLLGADDPSELAPVLSGLEVIAIDFSSFTDGRGYSSARILRERFGYKGELRAIGDVLRDQVFYLLRCGFDALSLREDQDVDAVIAAYRDFSEAYQRSVERPVPLYRRRLQSFATASDLS